MQLTVPPDVEVLVQKRLATGAFANAEDVIRRALETLDAEESWTDQERRILDEKIDRALEQVGAGRVYGPEEAQRKLRPIERSPPANRSCYLDLFQLSEDAIFDIDEIWLYHLEKEGVETADRMVTEFFKGFYRVADIPNSGHRRPDLTNRNVLFYRIFSYLVIYQPGSDSLQILGVLHGKRNVARILRQRL